MILVLNQRTYRVGGSLRPYLISFGIVYELPTIRRLSFRLVCDSWNGPELIFSH
jgi:hypothetical protein